MTALKVVHPTQPYGPQAALLAKRADVVGELEAMSRKLAKLAEAQRAEEAVFDEIRRLSEDVGGPPSARRPLSDQIAGIQLWRNNPDGVSRTGRRYADHLRDKVLELSRSSLPALRESGPSARSYERFHANQGLKRGARIERARRHEVLRSRLAHSPRPRRTTRFQISACDDAVGQVWRLP